MWPSSSARQINYGLSPDINMRDLFVVEPQQQQHHHHDSSTITFDPLHSITSSYGGGVGIGAGSGLGVNLIPLLSATAVGADSDRASGEAQNCTAMADLLKCGSVGGGGGSTMVCLDCGNQAKKDCGHGRCRTCCKSRGYNCTTHLKSTWIPAATRRREKQPSTSSGSKKPRLFTNCLTGTASDHTSASNTTTPRSFDNRDASFKESFPEQVEAAAKFKCMRFISVEDGENEYAYEALVKIGGHTFKGVLYDNGIAHPKDGIPKIAELHLGGYNGAVGIGR